MNRIATTLTVLTAPVIFATSAQAEGISLESLSSELEQLKERLASLEKSMEVGSSSYTYNNSATYEATNGTPEVDAPAPAPAPAPEQTISDATPRASTTYLIKDGDTLGSIAREHGIERAELLSANRLSEGQPIYIGETLFIPGNMPEEAMGSQATQISENTPPPAKEKSIVVGETKEELAPGGNYTVVKGDTLTAIARKNNTSVALLKQANGLKSDVISLGQKLRIPEATEKLETKTEVAQADAAGANDAQNVQYEYDNPLLNENETYGYYTVRKGDNLYALARDFFTTMAELQRLNRLGASTLIYPGNELIVPTEKYNSYHNGDVASR